MVKYLQRVTHFCNSFNKYLGRYVSWGVVLMVILMVTVVILRYALHQSAVWQQELIRYIHITVFMSSSGYALFRNDHVRVDVLYQKFSKKNQLLIDTIGTVILLIPFAIGTLYFSYDFIIQSWQLLEPSAEPLGLPGVYLMKSFIALFAITLLIQSLSIICSFLLNLYEGEAQ